MARGRIINETGNRYGRLVVIKRAANIGTLAAWFCECDCGGTHTVRGAELRRGKVKSCGCLNPTMPTYEDSAVNTLYNRYMLSARKRGYEWGLSFVFFKYITSRPCHYCGGEPHQAQTALCATAQDYLYNGIDRVYNSNGYVPSNVVPCCGRCNMAKGVSDPVDFINWIDNTWKSRPEGFSTFYISDFTLTKGETIGYKTIMGSAEKLSCKKCGNEWYPLATRKPKLCPKCRRDWREPSYKDQLSAAGITKLKCKKCGHKWMPRTSDGPARCPSCCNDWRKPYKNRSRQVRNEKYC